MGSEMCIRDSYIFFLIQLKYNISKMKGNEQVIEALNAGLTIELSAIPAGTD